MTFLAFHPVGDRRYREATGLAFEDFSPGQIFHHRPGITVSQQDNVDEALATLNQAMIHYDESYAAATEFKRPLVVSTLTLQRAVGMGWKTFGRRKRIVGFKSIRLTAPVFGGDTLYARTRIMAMADVIGDHECGCLTVQTTVSRADKRDVAILDYDQLIYRRDAQALAALGY
jgi:itaconyl-CoA hydratase